MSRERSRHRRSHGLRTLLALSLLSLAACNVGPDFQRPQATQVQAWSAPVSYTHLTLPTIYSV